MGKHTPLPWEISKNGNIIATVKKGADCLIAKISSPKTPEKKANAAYIIKAVNAHDELLTAIKDVQIKLLTGASIKADGDLCDRIEALIVKADHG